MEEEVGELVHVAHIFEFKVTQNRVISGIVIGSAEDPALVDLTTLEELTYVLLFGPLTPLPPACPSLVFVEGGLFWRDMKLVGEEERVVNAEEGICLVQNIFVMRTSFLNLKIHCSLIIIGV